MLLRFVNSVVLQIIRLLCSGLSTTWKNRRNYLSSCPVAWYIILSCLSDVISISGYIPTSGDITISTIDKFDLENMGIAVEIFSIGATELEI